MMAERFFSLRLETLEARDVPTNLGAATDFNAFLFGDLDVYTSDIEGRVAAGGNATLYAYGIGDGLPNSNGTRDDLIVQGDLDYTYGQVFNGNIVYGGVGNLVDIGLPNGEDRQEADVVDFAAAKTDLSDKSAAWGVEGANGLTYYRYSTLRLRGSHPTLNIFTVSPGQLAASKTIRITAPAGATVLINVPGSSAAILNAGIHIDGGVDSNHILWNFPDATELNFSGIQFLGNILAPTADITFNNGQAIGTFVANSLTGNGELHFAPSNLTIQFLPPAHLQGNVWIDQDTSNTVNNAEVFYDGADVILKGKDYLGRKVSIPYISQNGGIFDFNVYPGTYSVRVIPPMTMDEVLGNGVPGTVNGATVGVAAPAAVSSIVLDSGDNGVDYLLPLIPELN
jgi:choice-of-anchor A domain-containing protein